jgi:hypothetical protein
VTEQDRQDAELIPPTYGDVVRTKQRASRLAARAAVEEPKRLESIAARAGKSAGEVAAKAVSRKQMLMVLVVALLVPLLVSIAAYDKSVRVAGDVQDVQVALQRLDQANDTLEARGQPPVATPPADDPAQVVAAAVTAQVLASLPPGPTAEEVAGRLQGAVVGQLQGPTFDELARLVASYFQEHPPQPGPPPTEEQIRDAVAAELATNPPPPGKNGENGLKGDKGDPCSPADPACVGPPGAAGAAGAAGAPGRSIVDGPTAVRTPTGCVWRTTYSEEPLVVEQPAGDAACPPQPVGAPTVTTPPPPT